MELSFQLRLILLAFTIYRIARLIARDDGPAFVIKRFRYWVKDKAWFEAVDNNMIDYSQSLNGDIDDRWYGKWYSLIEGLECPYCLGFWLSFILAPLVLWPGYTGDIALVVFGVMGVQAFLWGVVSK